jgi:endogenous inhibitor of DNA gyrase (YacG/DUF329 family)
MSKPKKKTPEEIKQHHKEYNQKYYQEVYKAKVAERRKQAKPKTSVCLMCGNTFTQTHANQKYCCEACKALASKIKAKIRLNDPEVKEKIREQARKRAKEYRQTDVYKRTRQRYAKSEKGKEAVRRYQQSEKGKAKIRENYLKKKALREEQETVIKTCPICKTEFKSHNKNQTYCSEACRELAKKIRDRINVKKAQTTKICPICGKEFLPIKNQTYCSKECKETALKIRTIKKKVNK